MFDVEPAQVGPPADVQVGCPGPDHLELGAQHGRVVDGVQVGHSPLMCPNSVSIHAWSVEVCGRPKCCAIAHMTMNSRVDPEVSCAPVVRHGEQDRAALVIGRGVDEPVGAALQRGVEQRR
ncbi:MAG: hypothetical protein ACRDZO_27280 [Egibacteraceae bacterium]